MKQYSANISKGKEIIEHFINELAEEGIKEVPPWKPGVVGKLYASDVSGKQATRGRKINMDYD